MGLAAVIARRRRRRRRRIKPFEWWCAMVGVGGEADPSCDRVSLEPESELELRTGDGTGPGQSGAGAGCRGTSWRR